MLSADFYSAGSEIGAECMPSQATYLCSAMVAKEPDSSDKAEMSSRSSIFSYAELQLHPPLGWSKNSVAAAVPAASSQRQAFHSDLWGFPFSALELRQRTGNECFVPTLRHGFLIREIREIRVIRGPLQRFLKFFRIFEARFPEEVSESGQTIQLKLLLAAANSVRPAIPT